MKKRILIADDERDICEILEFNLSSEYETTVVYSAEEALTKNLAQFDLFLLDVMMEEMSGFQLALKIRKEYNLLTPIIFLTAKNSENDLITGFTIGADDYINKPFSLKEVTIRIASIFRRSEQNLKSDTSSNNLIYNGLKVDLQGKCATIDGTPIKLTKTEFQILCLLLSHEENLFSRDLILERVWNNDSYVTERTVDVHIARLRKKLLDYGKCIVNRVGFGYKFERVLV